jgi:hypothetical protein
MPKEAAKKQGCIRQTHPCFPDRALESNLYCNFSSIAFTLTATFWGSGA